MKYTQIHQVFIKYLQLEASISMPNNIILATSGGQDSLALFKLIKDYKKNCDYNLHVTYCNHQWRSDSLDNANEIHYLAKYWGTNFHYYATPKTLINEGDARMWRYKTLIKFAKNIQPSQLLVAHTLTDKIETFLYNFVKKCFADTTNFLLPIVYLRFNIQLLRPLINIPRANTSWLCKLSYLPIWSDYTNYFLKKKRSRIRYEFLPYIKNYFNPQIELQFNSSLNLFKLQLLHINLTVNNFLQKSIEFKKDKISLKKTLIKNLPLILQYHILKNFIFYCFKNQISAEVLKGIICKIYINKSPYSLACKKHNIQIDEKHIHCHNI